MHFEGFWLYLAEMEFSVTEQDDEIFLLVRFVSIRCTLTLYAAVSSE
jgi:hypothetical protein